MKQQIIQRIRGIVYGLFILVVVGFARPVYGAEENPTGFSYRLSFPETQVDEALGYYHLSLSPGQTQELSLILNNPSTEDIEIVVDLNGAKTNQNGVIEYGDTEIPNDSSLRFPFEEIASGPQTILLAAEQTKTIEIEVTMPDEKMDGYIAGGIQLMRKDQEHSERAEGSMVINQFAYVIAVLLEQEPVTLLADLALNEVFADQSNYQNAVFIDFSNIEATYLNEMTVNATIREEGSEENLFSQSKSGMRMAPNSFIQFPVSMNGERMVPGKYIAHTIVTSGEQRWEWEEGFEITAEEAERFNASDVELIQETGWTRWQLLAIILIVIVLASGGYYYWRQQKTPKEK
ncbi:DUF916 and DUF3324 domain-containing protein [Enterococcus casseliflavus]|nr:DUF916 and DUF3324 domain-containing protein [Enterococcus casseliflavus]